MQAKGMSKIGMRLLAASQARLDSRVREAYAGYGEASASGARKRAADMLTRCGAAIITAATGGSMASAATPMAFAAGGGSVLSSMMSLVQGGLQFGGAIVFGIGLILLAVNIRGDSPGGAPLIGAISMMIIGAALFVVGTYWSTLNTDWANTTIG